MHTVVLGIGISGQAAARYLFKNEKEILLVDSFKKEFDGHPVISDASEPLLEDVELVVKSPGIKWNHPWIVRAQEKKIPIIGEIDLALAELSKRKKRVLGVTGSNGKTTTTLLATHLLNTQGLRAISAGNVGIPLLTQVEENYDVYVVELSSFQLEHIALRPVLDGAVILNITPNHLDRHASFEEYVQAKLKIGHCLKEGAPLFVSEQVLQFCKGQKLIKKIETISSLGYRLSRFQLFPHDVENASAALALTQVPDDILLKGIETFVRPPHRLEFVGEIAGVRYINDSKATSVDAVIKAVQALENPIVLIAGGVDKGGAFTDWLPYFKGKVHQVIALGEASNRIAEELGNEMSVQKVTSLQEGIRLAQEKSAPGDTVLLSPGCSSYDQFKDYQHRGEMFRQLVREIL